MIFINEIVDILLAIVSDAISWNALQAPIETNVFSHHYSLILDNLTPLAVRLHVVRKFTDIKYTPWHVRNILHKTICANM